MKDDTPFDPLPLPESLTLKHDAGATKQEGPSPGKDTTTRQMQSKAKGSSNRWRRHQSRASRMKKNCHVNWQELKGRLNARLQHLDKDKLKMLLLACGLAAGIIATVVVALKLMPLAVLILAILGLGAALRFWERLSFLPRPF